MPFTVDSLQLGGFMNITLLRSCSLVVLLVASVALAQDSATLGARLDWVPISGAERNDVSGNGFVTATLTRSRLSIEGCFEGLPAAATRASLHQGIATGARGAAIAKLEIAQNTAGAISGRVELTREQRDALLAGHLYIQLHAARGVAPDNAVLWGFLLMDQRTAPCAAH
jgi:hypothetical protein